MHPLCKILNMQVMSICLVKQNDGTWVEKHQRFLFNVYKRFFLFLSRFLTFFIFFLERFLHLWRPGWRRMTSQQSVSRGPGTTVTAADIQIGRWSRAAEHAPITRLLAATLLRIAVIAWLPYSASPGARLPNSRVEFTASSGRYGSFVWAPYWHDPALNGDR